VVVVSLIAPVRYLFVRREPVLPTMRLPRAQVLPMLAGLVLLVTYWTWSIWQSPYIN
jgi:hypothetical protein